MCTVYSETDQERSERPSGPEVSATTPRQGKRVLLLGDEGVFTALIRLRVEPDQGARDFTLPLRLNCPLLTSRLRSGVSLIA